MCWTSGVAVNMSPCHGEDRGFDPRLVRQEFETFSKFMIITSIKFFTKKFDQTLIFLLRNFITFCTFSTIKKYNILYKSE